MELICGWRHGARGAQLALWHGANGAQCVRNPARPRTRMKTCTTRLHAGAPGVYHMCNTIHLARNKKLNPASENCPERLPAGVLECITSVSQYIWHTIKSLTPLRKTAQNVCLQVFWIASQVHHNTFGKQ